MCLKTYCIYGIFAVIFSVVYIEGNKTERKLITVRLKNGEVEGKLATTVDENNTYYSFQGLPYAKPPLGNLRFASPEPVDKWSGILDATKPASTCIEIHRKGGNEDCLYLNVYTPSLLKSLPVIMWIHGGGFVFVYANYTLNGVDFFMDEEIVFVTIHYRLGVFGFLSTEDDVIPGNFGLKDQVMAVNWVYENIAAFGGNPNKITIMGQSAGATSTSYLGMVPHLKGKINGIIQQSGSSLCPFSLGRYHRVGAFDLSTRMGVQTPDSSVILKSLRKADVEELRNASLATATDIAFGMGTFHAFLYIPGREPNNIKDALITEMSHEQLKTGNFNRVPRMIGINSMEGIFITEEFKSIPNYYNNYDQNIRRYIPVSMNTRNEDVGRTIKQYYTNNTLFISNLTTMVRYGSDDQFVRPILEDVNLVSKYAATYLYQFSYEGKLGKPIREIKGVDHGEELPYLFHNKDIGKISEEDRQTRKKLVRLWSNFAKYSIPTPNQQGLLDNQIWSPVNSKSNYVDYMDIGSKLVSSLNPHQKDVDFWKNLYKSYGNPPFDSY